MTEYPEFEQWWEEHGQYMRAGGGQYEKTFAYEAWQAALHMAMRTCQKESDSTGFYIAGLLAKVIDGVEESENTECG